MALICVNAMNALMHGQDASAEDTKIRYANIHSAINA